MADAKISALTPLAKGSIAADDLIPLDDISATTTKSIQFCDILGNGTIVTWLVNSSGHWMAQTDNTYDIGGSGVTRPLTIYVGTSIVLAGVDVATSIAAKLPLAGGTMTGALLFSTDNTLDIGASWATRPRTIYVGTSIILAGTNLATTLAAKLPLAGGTMTGDLLFTDNTLDIGAAGATRPRTGYFGTSIVTDAVYGRRPVVAVTTTTKTFVLSDANTMQDCLNAADQTLTIPANASVAFPTGTEIDLVQEGAGQVIVAAAGGVTIHSKGGNLKLTGQYSGATLKKMDTNVWLLIGDLVA